MDDSCVYAVRSKYAEDLEELVQCPVCFERPKGPVNTCTQGHHICKRCQEMLDKCPLCKSHFTRVKNYVVESLCSMLDEVIAMLMEPRSHEVSIRVPAASEVQKKTVSTQTDVMPSLDFSVMIIEDDVNCPIGFCQSRLPPNQMYKHVCECHKAHLIEIDLEADLQLLRMIYDLEKLYRFVIHNKKLGLVFLNFHIDLKGDFHTYIHPINLRLDKTYTVSLYIMSDVLYDGSNYGPILVYNYCLTDNTDHFTKGKGAFLKFYDKDGVILKSSVNDRKFKLFIRLKESN